MTERQWWQEPVDVKLWAEGDEWVVEISFPRRPWSTGMAVSPPPPTEIRRPISPMMDENAMWKLAADTVEEWRAERSTFELHQRARADAATRQL